jgi:hypothetical protein
MPESFSRSPSGDGVLGLGGDFAYERCQSDLWVSSWSIVADPPLFPNRTERGCARVGLLVGPAYAGGALAYDCDAMSDGARERRLSQSNLRDRSTCWERSSS